VNYWILQHNPAVYIGIPSYPSEVPNNLDYWCIRCHTKHVRKYDQVFIWHSGKERGIHNIGKIISVEPHGRKTQRYLDLMWASDVHNYEPEARTKLRQYPRILIEREYKNDFQSYFSEDELKKAGFDNLRVARGGIFKLDSTVGEQLLQYIKDTIGEI